MTVPIPTEGLVLLSGDYCGSCQQAVRWLDQSNVVYHKRVIDSDLELQQWIRSTTGRASVPQFFLDGQWLPGGLRDVQQALAAGRIPVRRSW